MILENELNKRFESIFKPHGSLALGDGICEVVEQRKVKVAGKVSTEMWYKSGRHWECSLGNVAAKDTVLS